MKAILDIAHQKAGFFNDDLIIRLKSFPIVLLQNINLTDKTFLDDFELKYNDVIQEIEDAI